MSARGKAERRPGLRRRCHEPSPEGVVQTFCYALAGLLNLGGLQSQGGAARLTPLRSALGWLVLAPLGQRCPVTWLRE